MPPLQPVAFSSKLAYGVGQVAEGLKNTAFGLFVLFYYNQVLGVPGSLCGLAMGIALLFDAITDPLAGSLSDNWHSRFGRRHPFMYASALPLGIAFFGLFSPPQLTEQGLFLWLLCFAVLTRSAMTLYHVPHIALGAELSDDFEERTAIVAWRQAFGYVGALIAGGLAFLYYFSDAHGGRLNQAAYAPFAAVLSVGMVVSIWISAWGTRKEIPRLPTASPATGGSTLTRLVHELAGAFRNVSFRWLFAGVLIVFVMVGVDAALNIYLGALGPADPARHPGLSGRHDRGHRVHAVAAPALRQEAAPGGGNGRLGPGPDPARGAAPAGLVSGQRSCGADRRVDGLQAGSGARGPAGAGDLRIHDGRRSGRA
jgi:Na+/melibiose symporter-like transporter